ncbi:ATP-dependent DNA helicase [Methylocaldum szegediense]|nr:ATP-binding domain-containing protein [Methylocaldum szegediense]
MRHGSWCPWILQRNDLIVTHGVFAPLVGRDDLEDPPEYAAYLNPSSTTFEHNSLAPTGRAARILGTKTKAESNTIHKRIYRLADIDIIEADESANEPGLRLIFPLKETGPQKMLFIVDESSMIGDKQSSGDIFRFGSGRLLADLIEYAGLACPKWGARHGAKILFVGDPAQLPPVGETFSPALSASYLRRTFGLECEEYELNEVMRQRKGSAILGRATTLRNAIFSETFNTFDLSPNDEEIRAVSVTEAVKLSEQAIRAKSDCVLITYSNAQALDLNRAVRGRLWGNESIGPQAGDVLLVNKNSLMTGLYNGDLVSVVHVAEQPEHRSVRIKGVGEPVDLVFRGVSFAYREMGHEIIFNCKILENLLNSPKRELSPLEQRALLVDFRQRNPSLKPKTSEFKLAILHDEYFNALQVKYGYALTCHKAQGGEWDTAVVVFDHRRGQRNEGFFRWAYTAVTRAKQCLVTVNAPRFDDKSSIVWGNDLATTTSRSNQEDCIVDEDWSRLSFSDGQEKLFAYHVRLREAWETVGISVDRLDHLNFRERYFLSRAGKIAVVEYVYNKMWKVSRCDAGPCDGADSNVVSEALQIMEAILRSEPAKDVELTDPFLRPFCDYIKDSLRGTDIRLLSATPMQYRLRMVFEFEGKHRSIDFLYDSTPKWTRAEEVGGVGASGGLFGRLREILGTVIR